MLNKWAKTSYSYLKLHPQYIPVLFFVSGFLFDLLTLGPIDGLMNILLQPIYHCVILVFLLFIANDTDFLEKNSNKYLRRLDKHQTEILHFCLGALLSMYTIFYFKSSSFFASFLFLLVMSILLIVNELSFFKKTGLKLKIALLALCQISYVLIIIPLLIGYTSLVSFSVAMVASILLSSLLLFSIWKKWLNFGKSPIHLWTWLQPIAVTHLIFLLLYSTKVIPPIPLSIESIGIYHKIEKKEEKYLAYHSVPWWNFWSLGDQNFLAQPGDTIYCFAEIFVPGSMKETIYFRWQKKTTLNEWINQDRIPIHVTGGRKNGFRGYVKKSSYTPGKWRVIVETEDQREIGRISLNINPSPINEAITYANPVIY